MLLDKGAYSSLFFANITREVDLVNNSSALILVSKTFLAFLGGSEGSQKVNPFLLQEGLIMAVPR